MPRKMPTHRPALAHRLDGPSDVYRLTAIAVPKVTTGTVAFNVRCGTCGQLVNCLVRSVQARRWRLRRLRLAGYGALALMGPAATGIALLFEPTHVRAAIRLGLWVAFMCGAGVSPIVSAWMEVTSDQDGQDGVRLARRHRPHSVRYAKDLIEDDHGKWHGRKVEYDFHDRYAEPLIHGPL